MTVVITDVPGQSFSLNAVNGKMQYFKGDKNEKQKTKRHNNRTRLNSIPPVLSDRSSTRTNDDIPQLLHSHPSVCCDDVTEEHYHTVHIYVRKARHTMVLPPYRAMDRPEMNAILCIFMMDQFQRT